MKQDTSIKLNVQHDYITLKAPNGNFTVSHGGVKASGGACAAFKQLDQFIKDKLKDGLNNGQAMALLTDAKVLSAVWPTWNASNTFNDDDIVTVRGQEKKYGEGRVVEVAKAKVLVKFPTHGNVNCDWSLLTLIKAAPKGPKVLIAASAYEKAGGRFFTLDHAGSDDSQLLSCVWEGKGKPTEGKEGRCKCGAHVKIKGVHSIWD